MVVIDKIKNFFSNKLEYTSEEKQVKEVIEKMVANENTKYRLSPLSQEILLKNNNDYYIVINNQRIRICNHTFMLNETYRLSFLEEMKELVFNKMEKDRNLAISEIFENRKNLLNNIIEKL